MTVIGDEALLGRTLDGRYVIHERIARGGMASVFLATDSRLDRQVAVKVMRLLDVTPMASADPSADASDMRDEFEYEARASAKLNHRGIVSVYDQGTDGDYAYLVMEYVPGRTLRDVMREEKALSPERALAYLEPVLVALSAAHEAHLIHRDVKPENVLISRSGEIKITDFGLARPVANETSHHGKLVGTVSYLSPEVVLQRPADPRADVYSCGAMLFEMLTGQKPHIAETPIQVAYKHVNEDIAAPSSVVSGTPDFVDALVARATDRDPARRAPDAKSFLYQVRRVQAALAEGVISDPELAADILPSGPTPATLPSIGGDEPTEAISLSANDSEPTSTVFERTTALGTSGPGAPARTERPIPDPVLPAPRKPARVQRKARRGRLWLILAVLGLIAALAVGWWFGVGRWDAAPSLIDQNRSKAAEIAQAAGIDLKFGESVFSESVPKGIIVSTNPPPGSRVLHGATITAHVSKGPERYTIPNIQGKNLDESTTALAALNLKVGDVTDEYHETIPAGGVIRSSNLKVGDEVKRGTAVDLVISKGPQPIEITDFTGKAADTGEAELKKAGFTVTRTSEFSDSVAAGTVISQTPKTGSGFKGDAITLVVSKGPEMIAVPNLNGMSASQAKSTLEGVGLKLNATKNPLAGDGATVRYQTPGAGSKRKRGSTVSVFLT